MLNKNDYLMQIVILIEELKFYKRICILLLVYSFLLIFLILTFIILNPIFLKNNFQNATYDQLTEKQMEKTQEWINELNPLYLENVGEITFTTNQSILSNKKNVVGINRGGDIIVYLTGNDKYDKSTLCHEILHSYINSGNFDLNEKIVQNIEKRNVCY